jgi:hypothetical protein
MLDRVAAPARHAMSGRHGRSIAKGDSGSAPLGQSSASHSGGIYFTFFKLWTISWVRFHECMGGP